MSTATAVPPRRRQPEASWLAFAAQLEAVRAGVSATRVEREEN